MKDLYVLTADADAAAVMRSVLNRHHALGIRKITFDIARNPLRDSGMVTNGPELARLQRGKYQKALLIWDYHGSGWEQRHTPEKCRERITDRLSRVTWKDRSGAVVLIPELEEWLWHNTASVCSHFAISEKKLSLWIRDYAEKRRKTADEVRQREPKELFEYVCLERLRRTISPRDFEKIASKASLRGWQKSMSFSAMAALLRKWFPKGLAE